MAGAENAGQIYILKPEYEAQILREGARDYGSLPCDPGNLPVVRDVEEPFDVGGASESAREVVAATDKCLGCVRRLSCLYEAVVTYADEQENDGMIRGGIVPRRRRKALHDAQKLVDAEASKRGISDTEKPRLVGHTAFINLLIFQSDVAARREKVRDSRARSEPAPWLH